MARKAVKKPAKKAAAKAAKKPAKATAKKSSKAVAKKPARKAAPAIKLHPLVNKGVFGKAKPNFAGGTLTCHCATDPVTVSIGAQTAHNHACGCTRCWKPSGAVFSVVAVVSRDKLAVTANEHKLMVV